MAALYRALGSGSVPAVSSVCLLGFFVSASRRLFCGGGWRRSVEKPARANCFPSLLRRLQVGWWLPFVRAGSFFVSQVHLALLVAHTPSLTLLTVCVCLATEG